MRHKCMWFATGLLMLSAVNSSLSAQARLPHEAETEARAAAPQGGEVRTASQPSPSPSPVKYKLLPYAFESTDEVPIVPFLRFRDRAEVRSLEMNEAISRFFVQSEEGGSMLRGATPGGAPTLDNMRYYRPHVTRGADVIGAAALAVKEVKKLIENRKGMPPPEPSPSPSPTPPGPPAT